MKAKMVKKDVGCFSISGGLEFNHQDIVKNNISKPFIIAIDLRCAIIDEIGISCAIKEFQKKYKNISPFLFGIILMKSETGGYQFFKNSNSKFDFMKGLFL